MHAIHLFLWMLQCESIGSAVPKRAYIVFGKCGTGPTSNNFQRAWILKDILAPCQQEEICVQELIAAHRNNNSEIVAKFTQPGVAYFVQLDAADPNTWYMADLLRMFQELGADPKRFTLVHLSDNRMPPHGNIYEAFYSRWASVFRNYWWNEEFFVRMQHERFLKWFPLGYSNHMKKKELIGEYLDILPPAERNHTIFFLGNKRSGNVKRTNNVEEIKRVVKLDFLGKVSRGNFGSGSRDGYAYGLFNSKFCLQIPGRFAECYRFYDSLETGCIPVFVDSFRESNYSAVLSESLLRFEDIFWTNPAGNSTNKLPFLRFHNIREMEETLTQMTSNHVELESIFNECRLWWNAVKGNFRSIFENDICVF